MSRLAVIVTGSRAWEDRVAIRSALEAARIRSHAEDALLIHGDAAGADRIAAEVAEDWNWDVIAMPAQWDRDRRAAGPMRNQRMVEVAICLEATGWTIDVHAFPMPESRGTWDMIRRCKRAGFQVTNHGAPVTEGTGRPTP